ncbi:MAG: acetyl-CoA C-acetyltransferase [Anaerolineae bacterium]|nr:acetyl-CoA C-acetyltransferase [Anaerolineae bacterium]
MADWGDRDVVIVSAARTPIGRFLGALSSLSAVDLGAVAIREVVRRARVEPALIDEVLMGNVVSAGAGQAPARQAAIHAGLPATVGATTLNKVCGSGLKAVMWAAQQIRAGDADIIVAGGMESMSNAPYLLSRARTGYRLGHANMLDAVIHDGLWCSFANQHMGEAAEFIAEQYQVSRQEMDEYALASHRKAVAAGDGGAFRAETAVVEVPAKGKTVLVDRDECPRPDTSLEALAALRPAFKEGGRVTPGNAPGITDGAAALLVMSGRRARELGCQPLARITGYAQAAVEPKWLFIAPAYAIRALLRRTERSLDDWDLLEVNEAFAAQVLADGKELGWDWQKLNVRGGAIALGHPIGASGARVLVTLIYALRDLGHQRGLAALCLGGGEAVALSVELV